MPASKRELSPPESEAKIRKLDEDGDSMPSKVATIINTGNSPERTAAPRTKKKMSSSPGGNNSRPSSPLSDSSESVSDPPFKKAKLLSTSAFSTLSSEESKSNSSLMQTTLTKSEEASIGCSNTNFVTGRDGCDKYFCIIQDSIKPKSSEVLTEPNEEMSCSLSDPVQTDHSYGKVSECNETDQDDKILQTVSSLVPVSQRSTFTESIDTNTGLTKSEAKPSHCVKMHQLERQKAGNIRIDTCSNFLDNGIVASEEEKEETSSEPQSRNKTLLFSEKAPCPVENVDPNEIESQSILPAVQGEGLIPVSTVSVTERFDQDVKCNTEETYHETLIEETCTDFTISHPLLTKTSQHFLAVSSSPERHGDNSTSTVQSVTHLEQRDSTAQFTFEDSELEKMQDQVSNVIINPSNCINQITEKLHENEAEQKMEMVTSSNESDSQNKMSNEKATSKDQEDHFVNPTPRAIGNSLVEKEIPYVGDALMLNGQLSVEIPTGVPEGISYAAVEMPSSESKANLDKKTEKSSTSCNVKTSFHEATESASGMRQRDQTSQNYDLNDEIVTAVTPESQESLCSMPTVDAQDEIQVNTSYQYLKDPEVKSFELHKAFVKHHPKTTSHPDSSEIIHQKVVMAVNMEHFAVIEERTRVSSKIENETITAESKDENEGNHDVSAFVPTMPADIEGEIQINTSDQYFKDSEGEKIELQEEHLRHQTKTMTYPDSSEIIHQEIDINVENSILSEQSTCASSRIEKETITAESKDDFENNQDLSAAVPPSPTVDVPHEIEINTSDQYIMEPERETFELQEESLKNQTKTMYYPDSSEVSYQEIVVAVDMDNSVVSDRCTHVLSKIENKTSTAESTHAVKTNYDGSAVSVSPTAVGLISPPEVLSALSRKTCSQYEEVSETSELSDVDQVECSPAAEDDNKGHVKSLITHKDMQTNVLPHIFSASATDEMNTPSVGVMVHNRQNIGSEEMPINSTVVANESFTRQAEDVQESFISNAFTEHSEDVYAEYYTATDVQTIEMSGEISVPTATVELDTNDGQEVPDSVNNDNLEQFSRDSVNNLAMEVQLSEQDIIEETISVQEVMTENVIEQTFSIPEKNALVPSAVVADVDEYTVLFRGEVHRNVSHSEKIEGEQMQTESIVVDTMEDNVISESHEIEGAPDFTETNECHVDATHLTLETKQVVINTEEQVQKLQSNEETIISYQQEDVHCMEEPHKILTHSDITTCENQIVYEPISSPESTTDGEVHTLPENNDSVRLMHTDIMRTPQIIYTMSALSTDKEMVVSDGYGIAEISSVPSESSAVTPPSEELEVNGKGFQNKSISGLYVLGNQTQLQSSEKDDSGSLSQSEDIGKMNNQQLPIQGYSNAQILSEAHTAVEIHSAEQSTTCKLLEQSNGTENVYVSVISANEDASDGQMENTQEKNKESFTQSVFTEQVQEVTGPESVVITDETTMTFTTENQKNQEAHGTCEEYVILEPVPVTAIHYDIITQAVAESGLSEEIKTNIENITTEIQQTNVAKDIVNEEIKQEAMVFEKNSEQVEQINNEVTPANCGPDVTQPVDMNMEPPECQILEDIEIGREIVVAEEEQEEDSDISIIEKPQESNTDETKKMIKEDIFNETNKDTGNDESQKTTTLDTIKKSNSTADNKEPEKPKKQEMNTQARTKARLAALAEQKAAASKRQSRREQLNLLALCQEIAEDIATDSMLLKKIEEEKQAAAAAAAKSEANKNESQPVNSQEESPKDIVAQTPETAEPSSTSITLTEEKMITQPSTPNEEESKSAAEPPKRRFFTSQVSVPLKAHEKKKLTRYQRLRQVELQREKMSWARVKKLKSDQANQMFSEMDWQASMSFTSFAMDPVAPAPQPVASLSKPPSPGLASASKPVPVAEQPKVEVSKSETLVSKPANVVTSQIAPVKEANEEKTEADIIEPTQKEDSKAEPTKPELRKSSRISKIESSKAASTPAPAPKGKATSKKVLPAVPPPMPNGLNSQSLKIEYKPYKPRPKYSPDDFELDDDPIPPPKGAHGSKATPTHHQARPDVQGRPASQSTTLSKNPISTQPSIHLKSSVLTPAGQISSQTKPASSVLASSPAAQALSKGIHATSSSSKLLSKILPTTEVFQKTPVSTSPQQKAVIAPSGSMPAASLPQVKPASTVSLEETTSSVEQPTPCESTPAAPPDDATGPAQCKAIEDAPAASVLPKEDLNVSNDTQNSDATPVHPENTESTVVHPERKTESEEKYLKKDSTLCQDQNVETPMSDTSLQKERKKVKEVDKDGTQTIIDAGQKHFGPVACSVCGMLYTAANPEDESQHLLFHNQFISAVKYVGWKKERILSEFPDGKIILVLPDDPKYALKKIEEIREMVDSDLGFQQVESKCPSKTKTFLFISNDKKVGGCLIAEHINEGYRVIEELAPSGSEGEKVMFERQRAWCCSTTAEPAICGISRIWVVNTMRRQGIASRMLDCLRNNFIYGSNLSKDEIAFSDPTPDGKLFATHYFGTSQFLVYNFVNGTPTTQAKTEEV